MRVFVALLIAMALAIPAQATTTNVCDVPDSEQIKACEETLDACDKAVDKQAELIESLSAQELRLQKALDYQISETAAARASADAWYRQPSVVAPIAAILGFVAGAYVTKRVQ